MSDPLDPGSQDALAMTHWPEAPNPAAPLIAGTRQFARGGISGVLQGQGVQLPQWSNRIGDVLQSEAANTAMGMATPLGSLPERIAALEQALGRKLRPDLTEQQVASLEKAGGVNFKSAKKAYDPAAQAYIPGQELKGVKEYQTPPSPPTQEPSPSITIGQEMSVQPPLSIAEHSSKLEEAWKNYISGVDQSGKGYLDVVKKIKELPADDVVAIAKNWFGYPVGNSKSGALQKLMQRFENIEVVKAKMRAIGGRTAG